MQSGREWKDSGRKGWVWGELKARERALCGLGSRCRPVSHVGLAGDRTGVNKVRVTVPQGSRHLDEADPFLPYIFGEYPQPLLPAAEKALPSMDGRSSVEAVSLCLIGSRIVVSAGSHLAPAQS